MFWAFVLEQPVLANPVADLH